MRPLIRTMLLIAGTFSWCLASRSASVDLCESASLAEARGLNLSSFMEVAGAYSALRSSRPADASKFLVCLEEKRNPTHGKLNSSLAETLMLYRDRFQSPVELTNAFLHYVINTKYPILVGREESDVLERLQRTYQESILLGPNWTAKGGTLTGLEDLRRFGQSANNARYGRGDRVPIHLLPFVESAKNYSNLNATWMAEMSDLAYWLGKHTPGADKSEGPGDLVKRQLGIWGYSNLVFTHDTNTDTRAFLAAKDRHLVLSFKGTSSLKNFRTDASFVKGSVVWAPGEIHGGFKSAIERAWPQITNALANPDFRQREIWVTGHSLGAALAELAAFRLKQKQNAHIRAVYTYGTPRVGDKKFVGEYDRQLGNQTFPHINHNDIVPRAPPAWPGFGFRPAANEQTREFTGVTHAIRRRAQGLETAGDPEKLMRQVLKEIDGATAYLEGNEGPINVYAVSTETSETPLGEHGSYEYLFKLACVVMDEHFWRDEKRQARK